MNLHDFAASLPCLTHYPALSWSPFAENSRDVTNTEFKVSKSEALRLRVIPLLHDIDENGRPISWCQFCAQGRDERESVPCALYTPSTGASVIASTPDQGAFKSSANLQEIHRVRLCIVEMHVNRVFGGESDGSHSALDSSFGLWMKLGGECYLFNHELCDMLGIPNANQGTETSLLFHR